MPSCHVRRTLVKRNVKTGALAFDSGVLTKMLEKRGMAPPLSDAAAAAWDEHLAGQLLPADALEYLQVPDSYASSLQAESKFMASTQREKVSDVAGTPGIFQPTADGPAYFVACRSR
jgi:hypothetical protein